MSTAVTEKQFYAAEGDKLLQDMDADEAVLYYALAIAKNEMKTDQVKALVEKINTSGVPMGTSNFFEQWAQHFMKGTSGAPFPGDEYSNMLILKTAEIAKLHGDTAAVIQMYHKIHWPTLIAATKSWSPFARRNYFKDEEGIEVFLPRKAYYEVLMRQKEYGLVYSSVGLDLCVDEMPRGMSGWEKEKIRQNDFLLAIKVVDAVLDDCAVGDVADKAALYRIKGYFQKLLSEMVKTGDYLALSEDSFSLAEALQHSSSSHESTREATRETSSEASAESSSSVSTSATPSIPGAALSAPESPGSATTATPALGPKETESTGLPIKQDQKIWSFKPLQPEAPLTAKDKAEQALKERRYETAVMYYLQVIAQSKINEDEGREALVTREELEGAAWKVKAGASSQLSEFFADYLWYHLQSNFMPLQSAEIMLVAAGNAYAAQNYPLAIRLYSQVKWQAVFELPEYSQKIGDCYCWENYISLPLQNYYTAVLRQQDYSSFDKMLKGIVNKKNAQEGDEHGIRGLGLYQPVVSVFTLVKQKTENENIEKDGYLTALEAINSLLSESRSDHSDDAVQFKIQLHTLKSMVQEKLADVWERMAGKARTVQFSDYRPAAEAMSTAKQYREFSKKSLDMVIYLNMKQSKAKTKADSKAGAASSVASAESVAVGENPSAMPPQAGPSATSPVTASVSGSDPIVSSSVSATGQRSKTSHQTPIDYKAVISRMTGDRNEGRLIELLQPVIDHYKSLHLGFFNYFIRSKADLFIENLNKNGLFVALEQIADDVHLSACIGKALILKYLDPSMQASIKPGAFVFRIVKEWPSAAPTPAAAPQETSSLLSVSMFKKAVERVGGEGYLKDQLDNDGLGGSNDEAPSPDKAQSSDDTSSSPPL